MAQTHTSAAIRIPSATTASDDESDVSSVTSWDGLSLGPGDGPDWGRTAIDDGGDGDGVDDDDASTDPDPKRLLGWSPPPPTPPLVPTGASDSLRHTVGWGHVQSEEEGSGHEDDDIDASIEAVGIASIRATAAVVQATASAMMVAAAEAALASEEEDDSASVAASLTPERAVSPPWHRSNTDMPYADVRRPETASSPTPTTEAPAHRSPRQLRLHREHDHGDNDGRDITRARGRRVDASVRLRLPPPAGAVDHHARWHEGTPGIRLRRQLFKLRPGEIAPRLSLRAQGARGASERLRLNRDTFEPDPRTFMPRRANSKAKARAQESALPSSPEGLPASAHVDDGDQDEQPPLVMSELRRQWIAIARKFDERHPDPSVVDREPVVFDRSWRTARAPPLGHHDESGVGPALRRTTVIVDGGSDRGGRGDGLSPPEVLELERARRRVLADADREAAALRATGAAMASTAAHSNDARDRPSEASRRLYELECAVAELKSLLDKSTTDTDNDAVTAASVHEARARTALVVEVSAASSDDPAKVEAWRARMFGSPSNQTQARRVGFVDKHGSDVTMPQQHDAALSHAAPVRSDHPPDVFDAHTRSVAAAQSTASAAQVPSVALTRDAPLESQGTGSQPGSRPVTPERILQSKTDLSTLGMLPVCQHFTPRIPAQYQDLFFPPLPGVNMALTSDLVPRYCNVDELAETIRIHLDQQEQQSITLANIAQQVEQLKAEGKATERHMADLRAAVERHLFNHRRHDRQMIEVMRRLVSPESAGIIDSNVTAEDAARAELLTQIDFMILTSEQRREIINAIYTNRAVAEGLVARAKEADDARARSNVRERMSYEQLALLQISEENPSVLLMQFLDTHAPKDEEGHRIALDRTSPFRTLDDLANESMRGPGGPRGRAQEDSGPQRRRTSVVDHVAAAVEMLRARRTGTVTHDYDDDQHSISTLSDASDSLTGEGDAMATTGADHDAGGYGHDDDRGSGDGVVLSEGIKEAHGMARGDAVSTWHENHRRSSGYEANASFGVTIAPTLDDQLLAADESLRALEDEIDDSD